MNPVSLALFIYQGRLIEFFDVFFTLLHGFHVGDQFGDAVGDIGVCLSAETVDALVRYDVGQHQLGDHLWYCIMCQLVMRCATIDDIQ